MESELGRRLAATDAARRTKIAIPAELDRAWDWMEAQGFAAETRGSWVVAPYGGDSALGAYFSDADTDHPHAWFDPGVADEAADRLLVIGQAGGDGSVLALWRDDAGRNRFVGLGSEGAAYLLADTAVDFLRLLAIGYAELVPDYLGDEPGAEGDPEDAELAAESVEAVAEFRAWVEETFGVEVPELWDEADDDPFEEWVARLLGDDPDDNVPAEGPPTPADLPPGNPPFVGDIAALLTALGTPENSDDALLVAELVGLPRPARLGDVRAELDERGLWLTVEDGVVTRLIAQIDSDSPAYARREQLLPPLTWHELPADVVAVLGEPDQSYDEGRRPGAYALRQWHLPQGYLCVSWSKQKVWGVTVGRDAVEFPG